MSMDGRCYVCSARGRGEEMFAEFTKNLDFASPPAPDIIVRLGDEPNSIIVENFPVAVEREFVLRFPITAEQAQRLGARVAP